MAWVGAVTIVAVSHLSSCEKKQEPRVEGPFMRAILSGGLQASPFNNLPTIQNRVPCSKVGSGQTSRLPQVDNFKARLTQCSPEFIWSEAQNDEFLVGPPSLWT